MDGKEAAMQERATVEREVQERRREIQRGEDRLDSRDDLLNRRQETLEQREGGLLDREEAITQAESEMHEMKSQHTAALESAAAMSVEDARKEIIQRAEDEMKHDLSKRFYELEQEMLRDADEKAKKIISESVQRLAAPVVAETTTSLVPLPNDEMKGRLIGREGRNIRAIEAATGVDLIIDDTQFVLLHAGSAYNVSAEQFKALLRLRHIQCLLTTDSGGGMARSKKFSTFSKGAFTKLKNVQLQQQLQSARVRASGHATTQRVDGRLLHCGLRRAAALAWTRAE